MFRNSIQQTGRKLLYKAGKFLLVAVIGYITWNAVVGQRNGSQGEQLYQDGKKLYESHEHTTASYYELDNDSFYIYVKEKRK